MSVLLALAAEGAVVALVAGPVGAFLGSVVLTRSRRSASTG